MIWGFKTCLPSPLEKKQIGSKTLTKVDPSTHYYKEVISVFKFGKRRQFQKKERIENFCENRTFWCKSHIMNIYIISKISNFLWYFHQYVRFSKCEIFTMWDFQKVREIFTKEEIQRKISHFLVKISNFGENLAFLWELQLFSEHKLKKWRQHQIKDNLR